MSEIDDKILVEIALHFGTTLDLEELLAVVLDRVTALLGSERSALLLFDDSGELSHAVSHGLEPGPDGRLSISWSLVEEVRQGGVLKYTYDTGGDQAFADRASVQALALRYLVGVPILSGERVMAVLYSDSRMLAQPRQEERLERIEAVCGLVATALENARLYEAERFRARLLARMVHDLRSPIQAVMANATVLTEEGAGDWVSDTAQDIEVSASGMARVVQNTLDLARLEGTRRLPAAEPLHLVSALQDHLSSYRALCRQRDVRVELSTTDPEFTLAVPKPQLWIVIDNLLSNAIHHAPNGTVVSVSVSRARCRAPEGYLPPETGSARHMFERIQGLSADPEQGFIHVAIANAGPTLSAEMCRKIFREFERGAETKARLSTGLGLPIVAECVRILGGAIWMESTEETGTTVTVSFPVASR